MANSGTPRRSFRNASIHAWGQEDGVLRNRNVSAWDTRVVGYYLEMESNFLCRVFAYDKISTDFIRAYYQSVIAGTIVCPTGDVLYTDGMRISGMLITYLGNSIVNSIQIAVRAEKAGICNLEEVLRGTGPLKVLTSGDDSVVRGEKLAVKAFANFLEHSMESGFIRKEIDPDEPTEVIEDFASVEFCSHHYTPVKIDTFFGSDSVWMPIRSGRRIYSTLLYDLSATQPGNLDERLGLLNSTAISTLAMYPHIPWVRATTLAILSQVQRKGKNISWKEDWLEKSGLLPVWHKYVSPKVYGPESFVVADSAALAVYGNNIPSQTIRSMERGTRSPCRKLHRPTSLAALAGRGHIHCPAGEQSGLHKGGAAATRPHGRSAGHHPIECLATALGLSAYNGDSMTSIAKRCGVTRAAVSKRCVDITERLNLPPSRAMRSKEARTTYRHSQLKSQSSPDARSYYT